jgi:hypothetical protein
MNNLKNSASQRSNISANSSNRGMLQNQTYIKDLVIVITNETTQILYIASIMMVAFIGKKPKDFRSKTPPPQYNQRGGASNRGGGHGRGPYTMKPPYCMYHDSETNHHTKDCSIYLDTKKKMEQDLAQLSHPVLRPKPDAHRMYAQDQVVIHTVRM